MAWNSGQNLTYSLTIIADMTAKQYHVVKADGGQLPTYSAAEACDAIGVLQNKPNSGEHGTVIVQGITKGFTYGTIAAGQSVSVSSSMFTLAVASTNGTGTVAVGKALEACTSGSINTFLIDFTNAGLLTASHGG